MTATAAAALSLAASQNGIQESPAGSNICKFSLWYGATGPWCAMYLSWVWYSLGMRFSGAQSAKGWASAELMHQYFKAHGWMHSTPMPGDVVFWHMSGGHAGANHVSMFVSHPSASVERTWDGNTSTSNDRDGGHVERRDRPHSSSSGYVIGYGRPPYARSTTAPAPAPTTTWWTRVQMLTSPYMHGTDVAAAAKRLEAKGFHCGLPLDVFGPQMDKAVRAFQTHVGIVSDGDIGPTTAYKLDH